MILADDNVDILIIPITGAVAAFSEPFTRDIIDAAQTTKKPIFVVWGAPAGTDDTYYKRLLDGGLPVFRTFDNCVDAVVAYQDYWTFAARYRSPFDDVPAKPSPAAKKARALLDGLASGEALSEWQSKQLLKAYGIKSSKDELVQLGRGRRARRERDRLPGRDEGRVARPAAQERRRSRQGRRRLRQGSPRRLRRPARQGQARRTARRDIEGVLVSEMVSGGVETLIGVSQDELFGPVVTIGLGGIFVEVFGDVTFRVPPFDEGEARRAVHELKGASCSRACAARSRPMSMRSSTRS